MPQSIFPPLPFQLPTISFPFHNLEIECSPICSNHEYYTDLFLNDFLLIIPECFGILAVFIVLLHGVVWSNSTVSGNFNIGKDKSLPEGALKERVGSSRQSPEGAGGFVGFAQTPGFVTKQMPYSSVLQRQDFGGILGVNSSWIAILSIGFIIVLFSNSPISNASVLYSCFLLDDFVLFLKILVVGASGFSIIISLGYLEREKLNNFEFQTIILISTIMMLFLICSVDFISIYLAIECQSLCFYVMAGMKRESEFSTEAGLKYFLLGAFSSGILLFGFALQYGFTGTTNFSELSKIFVSINEAMIDGQESDGTFGFGEFAQTGSSILPGSFGCSAENVQFIAGSIENDKSLWLKNGLSFGESPLAHDELTPLATKRGCELGMIFILVGFLFKLSAVPFHMWAPDVYEGAPTSVTAFFAIVPKISIAAILLRLCYVASYGFIFSWQKIFILSSIASMILGSAAALAQNKIKRLLAWSSIGHVGFLLTAFSCGTLQGNSALVFYLVIYVVMSIALFQIILLPLRREKIAFAESVGETRADNVLVEKDKLQNEWVSSASAKATSFDRDESDNKAIKYTTDLAFLSQTYPVIALTIMITMFSIAGIPPLAGFWSKAFLLFAAMSAKQITLAIIVILTSVLSCFYYIRIVKIMYFQAALALWKTASKERFQTSALTFMPISKESCLVWGITVSILCFFCFNATFLFKATHLISLSLS